MPLTAQATRRILHDVNMIRKNPLDSHGIYYIHDEENIETGYAMIVGTDDTPYFGGYYFFKFKYTTNYPFEPPVVTFCTNQNNIRFNPNLYTGGKVCVSILNTWAGEQWTACQNITSVLLSMSTLLCKMPLFNEPGLNPTPESVDKYNQIISFANVDIAICNVLSKAPGLHLPFFDLFRPQINAHFTKNAPRIRDWCQAQIQKHGEFTNIVILNCYSMRVNINYSTLLHKIDGAISISAAGESVA
jgi:ubiquitin-protein ligase